jgi:exopolysaccharide production protein ExoQ
MMEPSSITSKVSPVIDGSSAHASTEALPWVVGFYFAFRLFIVLLSVRVLGTEPQTGTGANLALNISLLLVTAFCCLGKPRESSVQIAETASVRWALVFLGFSCLSLFWSSAASLYVATAYWSGMAADVAIVAMMLRVRSVMSVADSLMKGYVWGACAGAAIAWILPAQSDLRLGDEELLGPNNIAYVCAFALLFTQFLMRRNDGKWRAPALTLAVTVLRSLSKTTIVALFVCEAFLLLVDRSMKRKTKFAIILSVMLVMLAFSSLFASYYQIYVSAGTQSETLTGRLGIWAYLLAESFQQPWIGHGFDSVWKVVPAFGPDKFEAAHAHNELLQQFYAYGLAGVCLFAGVYWSVYRQIRRLPNGPTRAYLFAFLIFVLVRGIADTDRFDLSLPLWAIVLLSALAEDTRGGRDYSSSLARDDGARSPAFAEQRSLLDEG